MIGNKFIALIAAIAAVAGAPYLAPAAAAEDGSADVVGEASSPSPKSPIKVSVVDYAKAEEGPGTLKLAGTAIANSSVYIYVDGKPFAQVAADGEGKWSAEDKTALDDEVHQIRVEQFDDKTRMLAGRAMFNISLTKPDPANMPPPGVRP
ncbi:hypothetical protein AUC69_08995 [Methyloceanibacter superfactus]|uniref:Bacterial Ig-like domain-containing protein n=1 Tax=Methyloceanibacter superfactus TaxID=1774969 RepID=A0A1E3W1Q9_9HYPH|nr:hypothetical protein [Methyloceanibacter superfactus]ODR99735.1 hypothetical protein AUC69_08995 [Methyloceanibacter superfactus]